MIKKIICIFKGHKWRIYEHDFGEQDGVSKRYKDVRYCERCDKNAISLKK